MEFSNLLLGEMNKEIHFLNVRLGVKSAWTIAVLLVENLQKKDYQKLRTEFNKWDIKEREGLISWLEEFPDHIAILKG